TASESCLSLRLLGSFNHFDHFPGLGPGNRPGLLDAHGIAFIATVVGIVGMNLARTTHVLAVERVLDQPLEADRDGLVHLVAHDAPDNAALLAFFATHALFSSCFWLSTVLTRAISLRTRRISWGAPS